VGTAGAANAIAIRTPALTVNKSAGAVFANTGSGNVALAAAAMLAGGEIASGNLTLAAPLNAGTSSTTLNTSGSLGLGAYGVTAGNLTISNVSALTGEGTIAASGVTLRGAGDVGSALNPIQTQSAALVFEKSSGNTFIANNGGLSLSGVISNGGAGISATGPLSVSGNLALGSGTLRLS
jgi:hypothetical protein